MLISKENKFLFFHVYKVAGTSVRDALLPYCSKYQAGIQYLEHGLSVLGVPHSFAPIHEYHPKLTDVRDYLGEDFYKLYKFSFVRDPFDWQKSLYYFMLTNKRHHQHSVISSLSFDEYIKWRIDNDFKLMSQLVTDEQGELLVDDLYKFESIDTEFERLKKRLNISTSLPLKNVAGRGKKVELKEETLNEFFDAYSSDYETLGYEKIAPSAIIK